MIHNYWFEPGFPEEVKKFILNNLPIKQGMSCLTESQGWAFKLLPQCLGNCIEVCEGMYMQNGEAIGHTWLSIDGCVFDPTAGQFDGEPDSVNYEPHIIYGEDDLVVYLAEYGYLFGDDNSFGM